MFNNIAIFQFVFFNFIIFSTYNLNCSFESAWYEMQKDYCAMQNHPEYVKKSVYTNNFYDNLILELNKLVNDIPNKLFLIQSCLTDVMVRGDVEQMAFYEEIFLSDCISAETKELISKYKENSKGLLNINCSHLKCSSTSLGHLFYVAKILESTKNDLPKLVLEIGGGFGNLAKCFKSISPKSTYVILDLPEMCAIQKMFINYTSPEINVVLHSEKIDKIKEGSINIIPLYFINQLDLKPDVLISTFALSEAPLSMQKLVIDRKFFNSKKIYICGQINGWKGIGLDWIVDHNFIINAIRKNYTLIDCHPFHFLDKRFSSYEILAQ